jgi:hypothetical protein
MRHLSLKNTKIVRKEGKETKKLCGAELFIFGYTDYFCISSSDKKKGGRSFSIKYETSGISRAFI